MGRKESGEGRVRWGTRTSGEGPNIKKGVRTMRSREGRRQQKTPEVACPREEVVKSRGTAGGPRPSLAKSGKAALGVQSSGLMEKLVVRSIVLFSLMGESRNGG